LHAKGRISGLTTAATIWYSAALGVGIGLGQYFISTVSVVIVLAVLILFPYIERLINRYRETTNYSIVIKQNELTKEQVMNNVLEKHLKIIDASRAKKEEFIILKLRVRGRAENHKLLRDYFIDESKIYKFYSKF
jgi:putative Mg2+ transporter-C (MgtC) family protein